MNRCNLEIDSQTIRLKDSNEIIALNEALLRAKNLNLDLIELSTYKSSDNIISVCIIGDYQKFVYKQKQKEKLSQKRQTKIIVKEVQFGVNISTNDYATKINQVERFLKAKKHVRIHIVFKGREMSFIDKGKELLDKILKEIDICKLESPIRLNTNKLSVTVSHK